MRSSHSFSSGFSYFLRRPPQFVSSSEAIGLRIEAGQFPSSHLATSARKASRFSTVQFPPGAANQRGARVSYAARRESCKEWRAEGTGSSLPGGKTFATASRECFTLTRVQSGDQGGLPCLPFSPS